MMWGDMVLLEGVYQQNKHLNREHDDEPSILGILTPMGNKEKPLEYQEIPSGNLT